MLCEKSFQSEVVGLGVFIFLNRGSNTSYQAEHKEKLITSVIFFYRRISK